VRENTSQSVTSYSVRLDALRKNSRSLGLLVRE
jgi:hypothetical protein